MHAARQPSTEASPALLWEAERDGRRMYANAAWSAFTGREAADWLEAVHPEDRERVRFQVRAACADERPYDIEFRMLRAGGGSRRVVERASPMRDEHGQFTGHSGWTIELPGRIVGDPSARSLGHVLDQLGVVTFVMDEGPPLRVRHISANVEALTGYPHESWSHELWESGIHPEDRERVLAGMDARERYDEEYRWQVADGTYRRFRERWHRLPSGELAGLWEDVTGRAAIQAALRDSEELLSNVQRVARTGWWIWDISEDHIHWSPEIREIFGMAEEEPENRFEFFASRVHPEDLDEVRRRVGVALEGGGDYEAQFRIVRPDGSVRHLHARGEVQRDGAGVPQRLLGATHDLTDLKEAEAELRESEERLRQSQKMEAIGRLAGGVAHDFNNLLVGILGYTSLLRARHPDWKELREIERAADRASDLTHQLLAFSRKDEFAPRALDVVAVIEETSAMLRRIIGEDIELQLELDQPCTAFADPLHITQILVNLAANARDALPRGGRIELSALESELGEEHATALDLKAGRYVEIRFADDGDGMTPETLERAFEPFFTTKEVGKGTGLGLSTVYGITRQAGGTIHAQSEPGAGARFLVYLPATQGPAEPLQSSPASLASGGAETILVVEDEDMVRELTTRVLSGRGYTVIAARNGVEALRACREADAVPDLLLTDVVMPKMSGPELAERIDVLFPGIRRLFVTGHSTEPLPSGDLTLRKPYTPDALAARVRELLDA